MIRSLPRAALLGRSPWHGEEAAPWEPLLDREWLVANGLGGYASGTVAGAGTRRYHGLLIASLPCPIGRLLTLARVGESVRLPEGRWIRLEGEERGDSVRFDAVDHLAEFRLEAGLPVWRFEAGDSVVEKRVLMPYEENTVHLVYRLTAGDRAVRLKLRPYVSHREHERPVAHPLPLPFTLVVREDRYEIAAADPALPPLRIVLKGRSARFAVRARVVSELLYRVEAHRGYEARGRLWTPGQFSVRLEPGEAVSLTASTEEWERVVAVAPVRALEEERERRASILSRLERGWGTAVRGRVPSGAAGDGDGGDGGDPSSTPGRDVEELALAADPFLVVPAWRSSGRESRTEEEPHSVVAGYHWFTDWGRDTMISLEGLTLVTGRHQEARLILRGFGRHVVDGLIPNYFPEGDRAGVYHTADATLWMFHALDRYLAYTDDEETLRLLLPTLREVVRRHVEGTRFGIGVDPADGLLRQGEEGYALTWMDAKVGDWVVTPRRGKAVEIQALWYNALRLLEGWLEERGDDAAAEMGARAARAEASFNERFWYPTGGHLYDVVDGEEGDDPACRPNQILAISLRHPVLRRDRWEPVVRVVEERLLTPFGLRTLDPGHPDYRAEYFGDLRARDAAYHQGTVWPWLIGPFVDSWLRVFPADHERARRLLAPLLDHLDQACVGSVSEIFDAEPPHAPRGCVAQAWSVAELLRASAKIESAAGAGEAERASGHDRTDSRAGDDLSLT